jgi:hypothetical protein
MLFPSFTLTEEFALGGHRYSWRLKEGEIRFRGAGQFERLVLRRIPVKVDAISSFRAVLDLLDVWHWKEEYRPQDIGFEVMDGSYWSFTASFAEQECRCGGGNAYPSYADVQQTALGQQRFALLQSAMYECFGIDWYVQQAKQFAARETS